MIMLKKKASAAPAPYDFDATFLANAPSAFVKLSQVFSHKFKSKQGAEDAHQEAYIKLKERYLKNPTDFESKTKSLVQWVAYYINAALNLTFNELNRAINRRLEAHDMSELVENMSTRHLPGLKVEENFDASAQELDEKLISLIEKSIEQEKDDLKRNVLKAWFIEGLDQQEITKAYGVPGGSISSIVSRFKLKMKALMLAIDLDAAQNEEMSVEDIESQALEAVQRAKELSKAQRKQEKADQVKADKVVASEKAFVQADLVVSPKKRGRKKKA